MNLNQENTLAVETMALTKLYKNKAAVNHLDLKVKKGAIYGFIGRNGAGKSTTLKMLLGLVRPTAGKMRVLGKPMAPANRLSILSQVGSLIESPSYRTESKVDISAASTLCPL